MIRKTDLPDLSAAEDSESVREQASGSYNLQICGDGQRPSEGRQIVKTILIRKTGTQETANERRGQTRI